MSNCDSKNVAIVAPCRSGISIIIPYPGGDKAALQATLDSVSRAGEAFGVHEILVVDDSGNGELSVPATSCPYGFRLIVNQRKRGFVDTCNRGILAAYYSIVICLQPPCILEKDSISVLASHFGDQTVFAVSPVLYWIGRSVSSGTRHTEFSRGFIREGKDNTSGGQGARVSLYARSLVVAYDRKKFIELGGFSDLYAPDLYEDIDICFRAWKRGWRTLHAPQAVARFPIAKLPQNPSRIEQQRKQVNFLLLHWSNITDKKLFRQHVMWCVILIVFASVRFDVEWLRAFRLAWRSRHKARYRRIQLVSESEVTDEQVFLVTGFDYQKEQTGENCV